MYDTVEFNEFLQLMAKQQADKKIIMHTIREGVKKHLIVEDMSLTF